MNRPLLGYAAALATIVALDALWLGVIARSHYRSGIGHLMAESTNAGAAVAFYAVYALGLMVFVVAPFSGSQGVGLAKLAAMGALFGFFAYATYDLTNLATLRQWPLGLSLLDMAWGMVVSSLAAMAGGALQAPQRVAG
jgi:uncharacterized membrane protein